jgi:hypothetical protein
MSEWLYRRGFNITNNTLAAVTDYQIKFQVYRSAGTSSGTAVYIGTNCLEDFSDVRFTDSSGIDTGLYDYWIETPTTSTVATCWVEVGYLPANTATTCYVYYGNSGVSAYSSGSYTFPFFDDFSAATIDLTKWTLKNGGVSQTSGTLTATANNTDPGKYIATAASNGNNVIFRARGVVTGGSNIDARVGIGIKTNTTFGQGYNYVLRDFTTIATVAFLNDGVLWGDDVGDWAKDTWYIFEIYNDGTSVKARLDEGTWQSVAWYGRSGYPALNIGSKDEVSQWDYAFTMNKIATAPTVSGWSDDEDLVEDDDEPVGVTPTAYRIVGIEYDQNKGVFILEFGAVEDYYMTQDAKYKGAYNNTISLM